MSHFKAKMHHIRLLASVCLSLIFVSSINQSKHISIAPYVASESIITSNSYIYLKKTNYLAK